MGNINQTIALLREVIADDNCSRMNLSTVKGYLGELLVKAKLQSERLAVGHMGNQSGYDLQAGSLRIDVKFSTLKNEFGTDGHYWGWALVHGNKQRAISCTHIVCVAVDDANSVTSYYVIPRAHINWFPHGVGQFGRVKHGFVVVNGKRLPSADRKWLAFHKRSQQLLNGKKAIRVRRGGNLSAAVFETA